MRIKRVSVNNFMSIEKIDIDLSKEGLNLVLGKNSDSKQFDSNGSGKSSLFDAIVWCMYGEILRNVNVDKLVRNGEKELTVSVTLDPEDGSSLVDITRIRKLGKKTELLVMEESGPMFPSTNILGMQETLNKWLGLDFKTFTNSVYFGKGLSQFFMVADDTTRKDILEAILQLTDFDAVLTKLKTKQRTLENDKIRIEGEIVHYTDKVKDRTSKFKEVTLKQKENLQRVKDEVTGLKEQLKELEEKKLIYSADINLIKGSIDQIKGKEEEELFLVEHVRKEGIDEINAKYVSLTEAHKEKYAKEEALIRVGAAEGLKEIEQEKEEVSSQLKSKEEEYEKISNLIATSNFSLKDTQGKLKQLDNLSIGTSCPTCFSEISLEHNDLVRTVFEEKVSTIQEQLKKETQRKEKAQKELKLVKDTLMALASKKEAYTNSINTSLFTMQREKDSADFTLTDRSRTEKNDLNIKAREAKDRVSLKYKDELTKLSLKHTDLTSKLEQIAPSQKLIQQTLNAIEENKKSYVLQLEALKSEIKDAEEKCSDYAIKVEKEKEELIKLGFWVEAFSQKGIRSFIFETSLPQLTERANYYSSILTGGTISIEILPTTTVKTTGMEKEKLNIIITNSLGASEYSGCSEGEHRRTDLCILLALQDLISARGQRKWNTIFYDELLDSLDQTGISSVIDLFKEIGVNKSIFIISHNSDLKAYFDSAIIVEKKNGASRIIEG
jgi:DNA repair exonuclease SbcCD ATPase subunit